MNIDYDVEVEIPVGNGDYDETYYTDITVNFDCELIKAQPDVGIFSDYVEIQGFKLPEEYDTAEIYEQVDSCLGWVETKINEGL